MRISDWSSDVCSSDLLAYRRCVGVWIGPHDLQQLPKRLAHDRGALAIDVEGSGGPYMRRHRGRCHTLLPPDYRRRRSCHALGRARLDRESVVEGKSVAGRVALGGSRINKKKKNKRRK